MKQLAGIQPVGSRLEAEPSDIGREGSLKVQRARSASKISIGTPEHAALVKAVKREFPEIYRLTGKRASIRRS
jgi:hypothetical protein